MKFETEFLSNKVFREQALSFDNMAAVRTACGDVQMGAFPQENGDVLFRLNLPKAETVTVHASVSRKTSADVSLTRQEGGYFEGVLPYQENLTGPANVTVLADGVETLVPDLPIIWAGCHPANNVEIPDPEDGYLLIRDTPHGALTREIFWSKAIGDWEHCMIYTPPGYQKSEDRYPVLYLQHGGGDNETSWVSTGRANFIFDNLIAAGKCVPFIAVAVNNMYRYDPGEATNHVDGCTEDVLLNSCIPHIDRTYRTLPDKWHRALCGLSLGALMGCDCVFRHPETFGSMGFFTSIFEHESYQNTLGRPWEQALKNPDEIRKNYKVIFCSATPQEDHLPFFLNDARLMREAGLEGTMPGYVREIHDGRFTRWCSWRMGLRRFAELLFRDE